MPLQVKKVQMKLKDGQQYVDGDLLFNVDAQAWARGTRNGQTITDINDPAYHNNAKYYAEQIPILPTVAGNYVLKVTITEGAPSYSWVAAT